MGNPMDLFRLEGKVALVTGAGSGLGRQFSEVLAEAGADVACADIDEASARAAAAAVQGLGRRGAAIGCDVTAEAEVEAMVTRTVEVLGRLDILFNNAGIADPWSCCCMRTRPLTGVPCWPWTWMACSSARGKR